MLSAIGSHVRRNVVAYVAIFLALGGTGYAATKIGTNDIRNGAVTTKKLHNKAVTKRKLAANLGLVKGKGQLLSRSFSSPETGFITNPPTLADIPGFGKVQFIACFNREIRVRLLSNDNAPNFSFSGEVRAGGVPAGTGQEHNVDMDGGVLGHGGGTPLIGKVNTPNGFTLGMTGKWDWQVWRGDGSQTQGAHVFVSGEDIDADNTCRVSATTYLQR
jgi:hypothetical protein